MLCHTWPLCVCGVRGGEAYEAVPEAVTPGVQSVATGSVVRVGVGRASDGGGVPTNAVTDAPPRLVGPGPNYRHPIAPTYVHSTLGRHHSESTIRVNQHQIQQSVVVSGPRMLRIPLRVLTTDNRNKIVTRYCL